MKLGVDGRKTSGDAFDFFKNLLNPSKPVVPSRATESATAAVSTGKTGSAAQASTPDRPSVADRFLAATRAQSVRPSVSTPSSSTARQRGSLWTDDPPPPPPPPPPSATPAVMQPPPSSAKASVSARAGPAPRPRTPSPPPPPPPPPPLTAPVVVGTGSTVGQLLRPGLSSSIPHPISVVNENLHDPAMPTDHVGGGDDDDDEDLELYVRDMLREPARVEGRVETARSLSDSLKSSNLIKFSYHLTRERLLCWTRSVF